MIKIVGIDLDGTLLDDKKEISTENKKTLQKAKNLGVKIVLCTGRPLGGMSHYLDELGLRGPDDYAVTYNGGLVQKTDSRQIVSQIYFSLEEVRDIYQKMSQIGLPVNFIDLDYIHEPPYPAGLRSNYAKSMPYLVLKSLDMENLASDLKINKAVINADPHLIEGKVADFETAFAGDYSMMRSHPHQMEIMPKGVDKGAGLQQLGKLLKVSKNEMMAIGDEENDLAMIEYAGLGVAMENANEKVKALAQKVTKNNNESGVAYAVNEWVLPDYIN